MRIITVILLLVYSSLSLAENDSDQYFCDINALKTIDYSADIAGYYQDDYDAMFPKWLAKAKSGDKKYQFYVAKAFQYGQGVAQNKKSALEWYTKSSDQGYAIAKNNLSFFYTDGVSLEKDLDKHFELLCDASMSGFSMATYNIYRFYFDYFGDERLSFEWAMKSATQGYSNGINDVGWMYGGGFGVDKNNIEAVKWYKKAAEMEDSWGLFNLGLMYQDGEGVLRDYKKSHSLYKKAANQGNISAISNLGLNFFTGYNINDSQGSLIYQDLKKSITWYERGVELGCSNCAYLLYQVYSTKIKNDGKNSSNYEPKTAIKYLELAHEMGDVGAASQLGYLYLYSNELLKTDHKKSLFWFHKSAKDNEDAYSQAQLAYLYSSAIGNVEIRDDVASVYWAKKASDQNNIQGKINLASSYEWGEGVPKEGNLAVKTYKEILELGNTEETINALKNIAWIYAMGFTNVEINFDTAMKYYKQAEAMGDKESQYFIGRIYLALGNYGKAQDWFNKSESYDSKLTLMHLNKALNGDANSQLELGHIISVFGNIESSYYWYEMAADKGNAEAQNIIGASFGGNDNYGFEEDKNQDISLYWVKKSAQQGDAIAQNNLGVAYQNGSGVVKDIEQAVYWYKLSTAQNYGLAYRNLGSIYLTEFDDPVAAISNFEKAFEYGAFPAAWDLGLLYLNGKNGIKINKELAFEWMMNGANKFYAPAEYKISMMYLNGNVVKVNEVESTHWLFKAYNNKVSRHDVEFDDILRTEVARRYFFGIGIEESLEKAKEIDLSYTLEMLGFSAEKVEQFVTLAIEYENDLNDPKKALYWYEKAAEQGNLYSQKRLSMLYSHWATSSGFPADFTRAEIWFLKAIEQGDLESMTELARMYYVEMENPGVQNPLYSLSKSFNLLIKARDSGANNYHMGLSYLYRFGFGTKRDVQKALLIVEEKLENIEDWEKDYWMWDLLSIHVENKLSNDEVFSRVMTYFIKQAKLGDVNAMNTLASFYLNEDFKYYDEKEAMYWLNEAKNSSFNANIVLSEYTDNYINYGKYLLNAIDLYESNKNNDFVSNETVINAYFYAAAYFRDMGAPEKVESILRRVSAIIPQNEDNPFRVMLTMTLAGISSDHEASKLYLRDYINKIYGISQEDLNHKFYALVNLHEMYLDDGEVEEALDLAKSALKVIDLLGRNNDYLAARITLLQLIAKDYIQLGDFKRVSKYFALLDDNININFSDEYRQEYQRNTTINNNVNIIWRDIIGAIIKINNGSIDEGFVELNYSLDKVNDADIPLRRHDLDLALVPLSFFTQNGHYDKASILMSKVIELYQQGVEKRINYDSIISSDEKNKIRDAISEYVYISSLGSKPLNDKGFEIMQLASGLTLSDTVIKTISSNELSGTLFIKSKVLEQLNNERRELVDEKFNNLSSSVGKLESLDDSLNVLDQKINSLEKDLVGARTNSLDVFLTPLIKVQDSLSDKDALITMLISNKRSYVWLTTQKGVFRHDSEMTSNEVSLHAQSLMKALDPSNLGDLSFPINSSSKLYELLISPFEKELKGIDRLIFSPDPILSQIPLSILTKSGDIGFDIVTTNDDLRGVSKVKNNSNNKPNKGPFSDVDWLIKDYAIAIIPSVYSYVGLETAVREEGSPLDSFIGIGNPLLSGNQVVLRGDEKVALNDQRGAISRTLQDLSALPETETELNTIAKFFNESNVITQENATETAVRDMDLSEANVIAFATHALVSNEIDDLFEPAIVLTPVDSDNPENDGLLLASEVSELNLNADIVLLSACNTASSFDESNSQGLSGLADSFFEAGAKALLASYWSVISDSAVDITTRMFDRDNRGKTYSHKHRESVLEILNEPNSYKSNPVYWAPFMVIGVN